MSPYLADEARVIEMVTDLEWLGDCAVEMLLERAKNPDLREAARRELLRRSLAVGVKG